MDLSIIMLPIFDNWLVVWLPFFIFPYIRNNHPNWLSYFSEGFNPPTRQSFSGSNGITQFWTHMDKDLKYSLDYGKHVFRPTFLQDGPPKKAKLPYKWLNYGLWVDITWYITINNYSSWALQTKLWLGGLLYSLDMFDRCRKTSAAAWGWSRRIPCSCLARRAFGQSWSPWGDPKASLQIFADFFHIHLTTFKIKNWTGDDEITTKFWVGWCLSRTFHEA